MSSVANASFAPPPLPQDGCVDAWIVDAQQMKPLPLDQVSSLLSAEELQKAKTYRFDRLRSDYMNFRILVRKILASYLKCPPRDIRFSIGKYGKPAIESPRTERDLHFNISHSGQKLLVCVSSCPMGVDIEEPKLGVSFDEIASFFSPGERDQLATYDGYEKVQAFYKCWTSKEAYIKAIGRGISMPLSSFTVCADPMRSPQVICHAKEGRQFNLSSLSGFDMDEKYVATLAFPGKLKKINRLVCEMDPADGNIQCNYFSACEQ